MRPSDYPPAIREVFETFSRESGIALRLVSCVQAQQAAVFADHFEPWELRLVLCWIKARVRAAEEGSERTGMSRLSLQWHCIFGNDGDMALAPFQQKLGLAMAWAKRQAPSLLPAAPVVAPAPAGPRVATDEERREMSERLERFRQETFGISQRGGAANEGG